MQSLRSRISLQVICTLMVSGPYAARAQLPLSIDALLIGDSRLTATVSSSFGSKREPLLAKRGEAPALMWRETTSRQASLGIRYGLSPRLELNGRLERSELAWDIGGQLDGGTAGERLVLGANWLAGRGSAGSLLLDARVDALARPPESSDSWRSATGASVGGTWYRALDPVVLSLAARYRHERARPVEGGKLHPGDLIAAEASVNFAVNDRVTLLGGFAVQRREADRLERRAVSRSRLLTAMDAGIAVAPWSGATLFLRGRLPLGSADVGGSIAVELLNEF